MDPLLEMDDPEPRACGSVSRWNPFYLHWCQFFKPFQFNWKSVRGFLDRSIRVWVL